MNIDQFAQAQQECAQAMLGALVSGARRRFLCSARLLEWRSPTIESLESLGIQNAVDLWPLFGAFGVLCERYREALYNPQQPLFDRVRAAQDEAWSQYYYLIFLPCALQDDNLVRNVLRSVGGLPSSDLSLAQDAVRQHFTDMTLPTQKPAWAPEDVLTHR